MTFTNPINSKTLVRKYDNIYTFLNEWIEMRIEIYK